MNGAPVEGGARSAAASRQVPVGRLVHKADFERLLRTPGRWRSAHFALHHVSASPSRVVPPSKAPSGSKLSTIDAPDVPQTVNNSPAGQWLGVVVPKRHARRAVTRSLIKRQMRGIVQAHAADLPCGLWLLRLRQPFAISQFPAAASLALLRAVRAELVLLLAQAANVARGTASELR